MRNDLLYFKVVDQPELSKPDDTGTKKLIVPVIIIIYFSLYYYYRFI